VNIKKPQIYYNELLDRSDQDIPANVSGYTEKKEPAGKPQDPPERS